MIIGEKNKAAINILYRMKNAMAFRYKASERIVIFFFLYMSTTSSSDNFMLRSPVIRRKK